MNVVAFVVSPIIAGCLLQLSVVLDLIAYAVRLGGDVLPTTKTPQKSAGVNLDALIFDRYVQ